MIDELTQYDAVALGELIRNGEISPVELLDATIQQIEEFNPRLNAVIHKTYDLAREAAENWSSAINAGNASEMDSAGTVFWNVYPYPEFNRPTGDVGAAILE